MSTSLILAIIKVQDFNVVFILSGQVVFNKSGQTFQDPDIVFTESVTQTVMLSQLGLAKHFKILLSSLNSSARQFKT